MSASQPNGDRKPTRRRKVPTADIYFDRQPPFDLQAEIGVLGSIVLLPNVLDDVVTILRPDDFYDDAHRKLFSCMRALHEAGKKIDPTLLIDRLKSAGEFESIGGSAYLSKIISAVPNAAHATYYAEIVRTKAAFRSLISASTEILRDAYDEARKPEEITSCYLDRLASLDHSQVNGARTIGDVAEEAITEIETAADSPAHPAAMTGIPVVDENMGGYMPGELITLGARPGAGKTTLAAETGLYNAGRGRPVLFVSLEMRGAELVRRVLASRSGIDGRDLRLGRVGPRERIQLREAQQQLADLPFWIWTPASASVANIRTQARYRKTRGGLQLLIIDYVGLIRASADDARRPRYEHVSAISAGLKAIAKELSVPVLSLCQLNREADGEEPRLSHLRESGAIEQDSDVVLFLHHVQPKPSKTGPSERDIHGPHEAYLLVAKHRHSQTGRIRLDWYPSETRFEGSTSF